MYRTMGFDDRLKLLGKIASAIGWCMSIYFSAQGFGLGGGPGYVVAGYFLACLVTLCEVFLGRYGAKMPRVLVGLCLLATAYGIATNIVGILAGRGGSGVGDLAIALTLGIVLELYPERLYMFVSGVESSDLWEAIRSIFPERKRQGFREQSRREPPIYNRPGAVKRQLDPDNPRRNGRY